MYVVVIKRLHKVVYNSMRFEQNITVYKGSKIRSMSLNKSKIKTRAKLFAKQRLGLPLKSGVKLEVHVRSRIHKPLLE